MQDAVAFNLRLPQAVYEAVREAAHVRHVSMNTAITQAVEDWLGRAAREEDMRAPLTEQRHRELVEQHQKLQEAYRQLVEEQQRQQAKHLQQERALRQTMQQLTQQLALWTEGEGKDIEKTA
jgi:hypothetical protein